MKGPMSGILALLAATASGFGATSAATQGPIFPPYRTFVVPAKVLAGTVVHLPLSIIVASQRGWAYEVVLPHGVGEINYAVYYAVSHTAALARNATLRRAQVIPIRSFAQTGLNGAWYGILGTAGVAGVTVNNVAMVVTTNLPFTQTTSVTITQQQIHTWLFRTLVFLVHQARGYGSTHH
jgi:hypothetical protein